MAETPEVEAVTRVLAEHLRVGVWYFHDADAIRSHVAAQVVAALDLRTERCCDGITHEDGDYKTYTCADVDMPCRTRLVGPWSEVRD